MRKKEIMPFGTMKIDFYLFRPCYGAFRISVPWPGTEPRATAVKAPSPNH